jgi:hypothetical protein
MYTQRKWVRGLLITIFGAVTCRDPQSTALLLYELLSFSCADDEQTAAYTRVEKSLFSIVDSTIFNSSTRRAINNEAIFSEQLSIFARRSSEFR